MSDDKPWQFQPGNEVGISGRWKPGQSGNPKGRPLSKPYKDALDRMLRAAASAKGIDPANAHDLIAAAHVAKCMSGDMAAIKEFADRTDGKVPNPIGGTDELPPITAFAWREPKQLENIIDSQSIESTDNSRGHMAVDGADGGLSTNISSGRD